MYMTVAPALTSPCAVKRAVLYKRTQRTVAVIGIHKAPEDLPNDGRVLRLSRRDVEALVEALSNPAAPTERSLEAARRYLARGLK
jgi:uncharacterized protein (DUF1778 family)